MSEFPELRAALVAAAERQRHQVAMASSEGATGSPGRRSWRSLQLRAVALAAVAMLAIAAVALAAAGVFSTGRPVAPVSPANPRTFDGAVISSTIRVLKLDAQDPYGGLTWGLRLMRTTRGEACITPGRVHGGLIGVLGRDGAFGDDGRLHPFARDYIAPISCALADASGHSFMSIGMVGLPSSALEQGTALAAGGCRVNNPPPANHASLCPTSALRDVYYGLLGPSAVSITYRTAADAQSTEHTVGLDGAYLVVLPYTGGEQGSTSIGVGLSGAPFLSVNYRNGNKCSLAHGHACQPVGYRPARATHLTPADLRAPVNARVVRAGSYCTSKRTDTVVPCNGRVPHGFSRITSGAPFVLVNIQFTARVPVTNSHSYYQLNVTYPQSASCTLSQEEGPTNSDIHADQRILMQQFVPLSCPGVLHGVVSYIPSDTLGPAGFPISSNLDALVVGRFTTNTSPPSLRKRARSHAKTRSLAKAS